MFELFDILAVKVPGGKVRLIAEKKNLRNAEVVEYMAVIRLRAEGEFLAIVPTGMYREGDQWKGAE